MTEVKKEAEWVDRSQEFIVTCECGDSTDHVVHIAQWDFGTDYSDANLGQCLISTRLDPRAYWYKRVWIALKYIFNVGAYQYMDTTVDVQVLKDVVNQLQDTRTDEQKEKARLDKRKIKVV